MQGRLLLAVVISVLILVVFQRMQGPPDKIVRHTHIEKQEESAESRSNNVDKMSTVAEAGAVTADMVEYTIENENIKLTVGSYDSGFTSLLLKDKNGEYIEMVRKDEPPYPLALNTDEYRRWKLVKKSGSEIECTYDGRNLQIKRNITVKDRGNVEISNTVRNKTAGIINASFMQGWTGGLGTTKELDKENLQDNRLFSKIGGKINSNMDKGDYEGDISWAGLVNRYFIAVFLDIDGLFGKVEAENAKKKTRGCASARLQDSQYPGIILKGDIVLEGKEETEFKQEIHCGLKEYRELKKLSEDLDEILAFGIFGFLSRLFLNVLIMFNSITKNYGVAIIILTMILQVVIFPLTAKSFKSMKAMKEIQPKINKLREKFKDDPQRMNQEMMQLYKRHKVNPFGGCLPIMLQMPIFISLFTMLRAATELRFAGFLWIKDLSSADVLFATLPVIKEIPFIGGSGPLPFLMGGAMFLQQKFTQGDMAGPQQNLTYLMPLVFIFLFMKFPSGLVLYWLSNSIFTFLIQYWIGRKSKG
ncbi:MAG: membrane protein insertase YidC [Elusimicrobia bacterium]|nr:membrane protein insertase YidC [Elusimicrobiota bacterium]